MNEELLLGIDIGTTSCKALVFDLEGRPYAAAALPTPVLRPQPGWAEYDPHQIWQTVVSLLQTVLARTPAAAIRGVAVASMAEAGLLIAADGSPLSPIIAWFDARTVELSNQWRTRIAPAASFAITGIASRPIFSLFKIQWLRDNMPEAYQRATAWLHMADYIAFRLSGRVATDFSLASRTMLLDLRQRRWSESLIDQAGINPRLLPQLLPAGTRLGSVTADAAAATGLIAGTAVGVGGHDHVCGALATGVREHAMCLDSMGP
ncbi:MAG TPA: FGGY family carbohydrate kinase, partial [Roseiflexaceae bacterium]|nr:FGGY family carbohydrate kinase [Roseiflexaceae bacterium]